MTIDTETDIYNSGNPFDSRNKLCAIGWKYGDGPTNTTQDHQACLLDDPFDILIGFNFKFDLHWLIKYGFNFSGKRIWDCQTAHYILNQQTTIFPSLNDVSDYYGLGTKLDVVKRDYWDNGITTSDIPWDILAPYLEQDIELTYKVFQKQWEQATPAQRTLIMLCGWDSHVLCEMEANGIYYDSELCKQREQETKEKINGILIKLQSIYPQVPINFTSNDHLSAFLYGGVVTEIKKVHDGFFKSGQRKGQPKLKNELVEHQLPGFFKPIKGSELKKPGFYATNEPTLQKLKGNKHVITLLLELAKQEKLLNTYYAGIPEINKTMNWEPQVLHSNFNQTQTVTGRLSSSKPNQQNFSGDIQDIFVSRFNE